MILRVVCDTGCEVIVLNENDKPYQRLVDMANDYSFESNDSVDTGEYKFECDDFY